MPIIAFYVDNLGLIPDELKPAELKNKLYNFIMKNHEYTKVIFFLKYPLIALS